MQCCEETTPIRGLCRTCCCGMLNPEEREHRREQTPCFRSCCKRCPRSPWRGAGLRGLAVSGVADCTACGEFYHAGRAPAPTPQDWSWRSRPWPPWALGCPQRSYRTRFAATLQPDASEPVRNCLVQPSTRPVTPRLFRLVGGEHDCSRPAPGLSDHVAERPDQDSACRLPASI